MQVNWNCWRSTNSCLRVVSMKASAKPQTSCTTCSDSKAQHFALFEWFMCVWDKDSFLNLNARPFEERVSSSVRPFHESPLKVLLFNTSYFAALFVYWSELLIFHLMFFHIYGSSKEISSCPAYVTPTFCSLKAGRMILTDSEVLCLLQNHLCG